MKAFVGRPDHERALCRRKSRWAKLVGLAFLLLVSAAPGQAQSLRIGLVPEQNIFLQAGRYAPIGHYLGQATGLDLEFVPFADYDRVLDSLGDGSIDGAVVGSYIGAVATSSFGVTAIARPVWPIGRSTYHGLVFVRKDSGIKSVVEMKGTTLALVSRMTTAGFLFPIAYFHDQGIEDPWTFFGQHYFSGSHDAAIRAVLQGRADVGCAKNTVFERMAEKDPTIGESLAVLARSDAVPSNGLVLAPHVGTETVLRLKRALLGMDKDPSGVEALKIFGASKFIETTSQDYRPVVEMALRSGISLMPEPNGG